MTKHDHNMVQVKLSLCRETLTLSCFPPLPLSLSLPLAPPLPPAPRPSPRRSEGPRPPDTRLDGLLGSLRRGGSLRALRWYWGDGLYRYTHMQNLEGLKFNIEHTKYVIFIYNRFKANMHFPVSTTLISSPSLIGLDIRIFPLDTH